LRNPSMHF